MIDHKQRAAGERDEQPPAVFARNKTKQEFAHLIYLPEGWEIVVGSYMLYHAWHYVCDEIPCGQDGWGQALDIIDSLEKLTSNLEQI